MLELINFGWNAMTVAFIGTVIFGSYQALGFIDQSKRVWKSDDGASVSALRYLGLLTYGIIITIYGTVEHKLALIIDGALLFPVASCILLGLLRKRGFSTYEYTFLALGAVMICATPFASDKGYWFLRASLYSHLLSWEQPFLIAWRKDAGHVSWKGLRNNGVNLIFWNVYMYTTRDPVLLTMTKFYNACCILTITLWFKYRRREKS